MKSTDYLWMAKQASAIDTALEAASWVPGFVGAGAGAAQGIRHFAKGNVLKGLGSLGMGAAQMFGGGTALKLLGKGVGIGSKLLKGTSMGAKALGGAGQIGSRVATQLPTFTAGAKRVGQLASKSMTLPETSRIGTSGIGQAIQNNSGKIGLGGLGAGMLGGAREANQQATQSYDQGVLSNLKNMAQSARESGPSNPMFAQPSQPMQGNQFPSQLQQIPGMMYPQGQYA